MTCYAVRENICYDYERSQPFVALVLGYCLGNGEASYITWAGPDRNRAYAVNNSN